MPNVLVVGNKADNCEILVHRLKLAGLRVCETADLEAGLRHACGQEPDLILLDAAACADSAHECRRLKEHAATASVPLIALASSRRVLRRLGLHAPGRGADAVMSKPWDWQQLWRLVQHYVRKGRRPAGDARRN